MSKDIERAEVLNQVTTKTNADGAKLAFQQVKMDNSDDTYYTFVWIKSNGSLSTYGRVQIPDIVTIFELLTKAKIAGWLDIKINDKTLESFIEE